MNKILIFSLAGLWGALALAQDYGNVLSATPVVQQVSVPRQVCTTEQVAVQQPKSGVGAAVGAIAGAALGSSVGQGGSRGATTVIGAMGGAVIGDRVEGAPEMILQSVQRCGVQTAYENRTVAYNVVYEFAGKRYSVQMPNDPGFSIAVNVSPQGALSVGQASLPEGINFAQPIVSQPIVTQPIYSQPIYSQQIYSQPIYGPPPTVVIGSPVFRGYYGYPYSPQIGFGFSYGDRFNHGFRGHRHRHGR